MHERIPMDARPPLTRSARRSNPLQMQMTPLYASQPSMSQSVMIQGPATYPLQQGTEFFAHYGQMDEVMQPDLHRTFSTTSMGSEMTSTSSSATNLSSSNFGSQLFQDTTLSSPASSPLDNMSATFQPSKRPLQRSMSASSLQSSSNFSVYSDSSGVSFAPHLRSSTSSPAIALPLHFSSSVGSLLRSARSRSTAPSQATAKQRRSSKLTELERKRICEYARTHPAENQESIGQKFGIERSTVSKTLRDKDRWLAVPDASPMSIFTHPASTDASGSGAIRSIRPSRFPALEILVLDWAKERYTRQEHVSDSDIRNFALATAGDMGIKSTQFKASPSWLERFKTRAGMMLSKSSIAEEVAPSPSNTAETDPEPSPPLSASGSSRSQTMSQAQKPPSSAAVMYAFPPESAPGQVSPSARQLKLSLQPPSAPSSSSSDISMPAPAYYHNATSAPTSYASYPPNLIVSGLPVPESPLSSAPHYQTSFFPHSTPAPPLPSRPYSAGMDVYQQYAPDTQQELPLQYQQEQQYIERPVSRRATIAVTASENWQSVPSQSSFSDTVQHGQALSAFNILATYLQQHSATDPRPGHALEELSGLLHDGARTAPPYITQYHTSMTHPRQQ